MAETTFSKTYRFAVVGAGQIAQQAFIPGLEQLPEAKLVAIVTGSPEKAEAFGVPGYSYDQYSELLNSGDIDAVYVAVPVDQHREYTLPALKAGIPVLCEKPMAASVEDCQAMIEASEQSGAPLMLAYRMHHDPYTLELLDIVRSGTLGELRSFVSTFGHMINPDNHRANNGFWAGPVPDIGLYPLNLVRNLYEEEPTEVFAQGVEHEDSDLAVTPTVAVSLTFPSGKTAQFTVSYASESQQSFSLAGTKGAVYSRSAFMWGEGADLAYTLDLASAEKPETKTFLARDQFAGETRYFLQCVESGTQPEANGEEGLMDIRICEAVLKSLETGQPQNLEPAQRTRRIAADQAVSIPAPSTPGEEELTSIIPEEQ
ncbi:MAG TPA: Gfo/Idh/MocA family oxidoreductase [Candidatus Corynebacterium gallistercoris]|uniref:Gfo/Idh/MocA family oxidoreductase n=1 Tax=Candidatus Corynebacterium gallistercoris TaxID=2838530 RepID=A0A9D1RYY6_9CORY|nr:Gfo/Idh/MocA family oxidoreductase [Candidatus Corynebacterium gallistercoris]